MMTTRPELVELLGAYDKGTNAYVAGPIGAGKTHIVTSVPEHLLSDQSVHSGFLVYVRHHEFDWDSCGWQPATKVTVGYLHPRSNSNERIWSGWLGSDAVWQALGLSSVDEFKGDSLGNPQAWLKLGEVLKGRKYDRLVIMLDNYDQWSVESQVAAHSAMEQCTSGQGAGARLEDTNTIFWTTGETPLKVLRDRVGPEADVVLSGTVLIRCRLPSMETAREIIADSVSEVSTWLKDTSQQPEEMHRMIDITGAYPVLVHCLAGQIVGLADKIERWDVLTSAAQSTTAFQSHLRCLYDNSPESHKQVLGILAIAAKSDYDALDIQDRWQRRFPERALKRKELERTLDSLFENRLLVRKENEEFQIIGSAFLEWVNGQTLTWALRAQSGVQIEGRHRGKQMTFLRWLFFGIIWYLGLVFLHPLWWSILRRILPVSLSPVLGQMLQLIIFLIGFLPAIVFFSKHFLGLSLSGLLGRRTT